jgi:hypothetical protein
MIDKDEYTWVDYFTTASGPQRIPESNKINKKVQKLNLKVLKFGSIKEVKKKTLKNSLQMKVTKSCKP